jgi:hypothetical protein
LSQGFCRDATPVAGKPHSQAPGRMARVWSGLTMGDVVVLCAWNA